LKDIGNSSGNGLQKLRSAFILPPNINNLLYNAFYTILGLLFRVFFEQFSKGVQQGVSDGKIGIFVNIFLGWYDKFYFQKRAEAFYLPSVGGLHPSFVGGRILLPDGRRLGWDYDQG